jgi:hypothetical protein
MSRISQLIAEIRDIGAEPNHRNSIQLHRILDGNSTLFLSHLDPENFNPILKRFEALADSSAKEFQSDYFKQDYSRHFELLLFFLNRV